MRLSSYDGAFFQKLHCVRSVRIRSYFGPYSVRMRENANQNNFEYGYFSATNCFRAKHHHTY